MTYTIYSRIYGAQTFSAKARESGFSYVALNGQQICEGGKSHGTTLMCNGTQEGLEREAKKWWRQYMREVVETLSWTQPPDKPILR
jgi:hypothetical protein